MNSFLILLPYTWKNLEEAFVIKISIILLSLKRKKQKVAMAVFAALFIYCHRHGDENPALQISYVSHTRGILAQHILGKLIR
jgi:hypothetical protein